MYPTFGNGSSRRLTAYMNTRNQNARCLPPPHFTEMSELPPELEREIFLKFCADSPPGDCIQLLLVAWRVKQWIEPLLYRTIVLSSVRPPEGRPLFTTSTFLVALRTRPSFFREAVRNLMIHSVPDEAIHTILATCTRLENLWAPMASDILFDLITSSHVHHDPPPLNQLYTNFMPLLQALPHTHPFFSRLTHLEVIGCPTRRQEALWVARLGQLPCLTHLAFNEYALVPALSSLFQSCGLLQVLVSLVGSPADVEERDESQDSRFVVLFSRWYEDWQLGVERGQDYWSKAESIVAMRLKDKAEEIQIPE
ncbi:hypothetical protein MIND_00618900 [Mycena indigotica]|uniref:Uncharacterized protein n=1 Tax=Mycena indigotica TaxID=2126181 RepID=A0A8H6W6Y4_9AGAR|nr:uncharacterized protein MIND_00618900 [Mycena indigotica]KAF7303888.1 hypothetical protein MIND_00618900 [Mycena indigotica]